MRRLLGMCLAERPRAPQAPAFGIYFSVYEVVKRALCPALRPGDEEPMWVQAAGAVRGPGRERDRQRLAPPAATCARRMTTAICAASRSCCSGWEALGGGEGSGPSRFEVYRWRAPGHLLRN